MKNMFKKIFLNLFAGIIAIITIGVFAISFPNIVPSGESTSTGKIVTYLEKILVNQDLATTDGKVKFASGLVNQDCGSGNILQGFTSTGGMICKFFCGNVINYGGYQYNTYLGLDGKCWSSPMKHLPLIGTSFCYNDDINNCDNYGRLYNRLASSTLCNMIGWSLPTSSNWTNLESYGAVYNNVIKLIPGYKWNLPTMYQGINLQTFYWSSSTYIPNNAFSYFIDGTNISNSGISGVSKNNYFPTVCISN